VHFLDGMIGFVPLDDCESYSPPDHLRLEIRSMKLPRRCLANAKPAFSANLPECLIIRQHLADAFVHLDEAVVGEPLIIHWVSRCKKNTLHNNGFDSALGLRLLPVNLRGNLDRLG